MRMAKKKKIKGRQGCGESWTFISIHCLWECKFVQTFCQYLLNLSICLFYDPATALLDIYEIEMWTYVH